MNHCESKKALLRAKVLILFSLKGRLLNCKNIEIYEKGVPPARPGGLLEYSFHDLLNGLLNVTRSPLLDSRDGNHCRKDDKH